MTPSNPDNQQPLIYRIADALGVFHIVAPVNHTHSQSEVDGLADSLAAKANTADVNAALAAKQNTLTFDTTPTTGSTNPVTSGGVKTALAGKADTANVVYKDFAKADEEEMINLDIEFENNKGVHHYILRNLTGGDCPVGDFFKVTYGSIMDSGEVIPSDSYAIVKVVFTNEGGSLDLYLITVDGIF